MKLWSPLAMLIFMALAVGVAAFANVALNYPLFFTTQ